MRALNKQLLLAEEITSRYTLLHENFAPFCGSEGTNACKVAVLRYDGKRPLLARPPHSLRQHGLCPFRP